MKTGPGWLFALFFAAFVVYTDDYVIAGLLPEMAADLDVTTAGAGQLVTVFSLTVAVAAPLAAVLFANVPRRRLFTGALIVFALANLCAAATPSYTVLLALRVLAALAAASMTPALFAYAAANAPPERVGRFIAVVALGVTGSIAAGVPIGTWIGGSLGWRATFATMAVAGLCALFSLLATLPRGELVEAAPTLGEQFGTLTRFPIVMGLLANAALMTGSMMLLTYLAPYLTETTTGGVSERAVSFAFAGLAGIAGIWLGGLASDRWGPDRTLIVGIGVFFLTMLVLWALWFARPAPLPLVLTFTAIWGGMAFWNSPAIQARLHALAGPVAPQALALNTSGTYLGVAAGGAAGGILLGTVGVGALPPVAAGFGVLALGLIALASRSAARTAK